MTLIEHFNRGGYIHFNRDTKNINVIYDSVIVDDVTYTEGEIYRLLENKTCEFYTRTDHTNGCYMVIYRADKEITISQRDREVFQIIINCWDGRLPGNMSYQDVIDLCDKIEVPSPVVG